MSDKSNSNVSKAQALGLANYLTLLTNYHFTLSVAESFCEVTVYFKSQCEMVSLESEIRKFVVDGCTITDKYLENCESWSYTIEYPCVFSNGY